MDFDIDVKAVLNSAINAEYAKIEDLKFIVPLLNKYGIFGIDVTSFLMELNIAVQKTLENKEGGD